MRKPAILFLSKFIISFLFIGSFLSSPLIAQTNEKIIGDWKLQKFNFKKVEISIIAGKQINIFKFFQTSLFSTFNDEHSDIVTIQEDLQLKRIKNEKDGIDEITTYYKDVVVKIVAFNDKEKGYEKYTLEHHSFFYILQSSEANSNDGNTPLHTEYFLIYNERKNNHSFGLIKTM